MTHDECVGALERCGYAPRQAAFLALVMRTGGYFLRRHYAAFRRQVDGAVGTVFLRRAMARGHVERAPFMRRALVYHVASPVLYAAIGEPHHRSQRPAPIATLVGRLMRLDVLVAHPDWNLLATEREILAWLDARGVLERDAGRVVLVARRGPDEVRRPRWIGSRPVCLEPGESAPTFIYVSSPTSTTADFDAFLGCHQRLFARLGSVRLLCCSAWPDAMPHAEDRAKRAAFGLPPSGPAVDEPGLRDALLAHFEARQRFVRRQFRTFDDAASRERLRLDLVRFGSAAYEALFTRWEAGGPDAVTISDVLHAAADGGGERFDLTFNTHVVPFAYPAYGDGRRERRRRRPVMTKWAA
jgi:hypothetical protein